MSRKSSYFNSAFVIHWNEKKGIPMNNDDLRNLYNKKLMNGTKVKKEDLYNPFAWHEDSYYVINKSINCSIIYVIENGEYKKYFINPNDEEKNNTCKQLGKGVGSIAYKSVSNKFRELNHTRLDIAFGYSTEDIKLCIPKQFYYLNKDFVNIILDGVSSIDFCSQYPSNLCGELPTFNDSKTVNGRIKPTEEYPFCFYLKSRTVAEYNKYDTHDWINSKFSNCVLDFNTIIAITNTRDEDEITIMCKASKYNLTEVMEYFYSMRKIDNTAKLVMNSFIGYLHQQNYNSTNSKKFAHLAAISIARSNYKMLQIAEDLIFPIHICIDGCMYLDDIELGNKEKKLNNIYQEFYNCKARITNYNDYVVMNNDEVIKFKHGGYNATDDLNYDIENPKDFSILDHLINTNNSHDILERI